MSGGNQDDKFQLVTNDELSYDVQPHLGQNDDGAAGSGSVGLEQVNPALAVDDENGGIQNGGVKQDGANTNSDVPRVSPIDDRETPSAGRVTDTPPQGETTVASPPVHYSNRTGETTVIQEPVVIRQPNGIHVIRTRQCCELAPHRHVERPVTLKHIKVLQAFSVVSIVIFFPLGIPALYYAHKCEKEFHAGITRGDMDLCRKLARKVERFLAFSLMAALLVAVAVVAIVERKLNEDDEEYWKNRMNNRVLPTG